MELINGKKEFNLTGSKGWDKQKHVNCEEVQHLASEGKEDALIYIAKLNVPMLPKLTGNKEIVLGTTKYLLPYFVLTDYFRTFAFKEDVWTEKINSLLVHCIGTNYFQTNMIRLVTTPDDIHDDKGLRITGKEASTVP